MYFVGRKEERKEGRNKCSKNVFWKSFPKIEINMGLMDQPTHLNCETSREREQDGSKDRLYITAMRIEERRRRATECNHRSCLPIVKNTFDSLITPCILPPLTSPEQHLLSPFVHRCLCQASSLVQEINSSLVLSHLMDIWIYHLWTGNTNISENFQQLKQNFVVILRSGSKNPPLYITTSGDLKKCKVLHRVNPTWVQTRVESPTLPGWLASKALLASDFILPVLLWGNSLDLIETKGDCNCVVWAQVVYLMWCMWQIWGMLGTNFLYLWIYLTTMWSSTCLKHIFCNIEKLHSYPPSFTAPLCKTCDVWNIYVLRKSPNR